MNRQDLVNILLRLAFLTLPALCFAEPMPPAQNYVLRFSYDDVAVAPESPLLNLGNQMTMETWVYLNGPPLPYVVLMGKVNDPRSSDPFMHYVLDLDPAGKLEFVQTTGQPGSYRNITSPSALPINRWVHVAASVQGTTMRLFVDGQQVAAGESAGNPTGTNVPFALGGGMQGFAGQICCGFTGYLRQARVWDRALTGPEILTNASVRLSPNQPNLVAQWALDDNTNPQAAADSSGNNLTLQLGTSQNADGNDARWVRTDIVDRGPFFSAEAFQFPPTGFGSKGRLIDFDTDGDLDFIDTRTNYSLVSGPTMAFRNNGSGVFADATSAVIQSQPVPVIHPRHYAVADFNNDQRMDLVIADHGFDMPPFAGGQSRILIQTADGRMLDETGTRLPAKSSFTHHVSAADIEGDGDVDLYMANIGCGCAQQSPELYINNGAGQFTANTSRLPAFITTLQRKYTASAFVDVNGDNHPDLILGAHPGTAPNEGGLRDTILLNDGAGNFAAAPETALPPRGGGPTWGVMSIEPADFNSDGKRDLLLSLVEPTYHGGLVQVLLNNGDGTFRDGSSSIQQPLPPGNANWIEWSFPADFNNDGKTDFIVSPNGPEPPHLFFNLGQARFVDVSELLFLHQAYSQVLPGDLDGDGDIDIFVMSNTGNYIVLRNLKPLLFATISFDYDGDGRADLTVRRPGNNVWYLLRATAGYTAMQFGVAGDRMTPSDYDGDGKTDVSIFRPSTGQWFMFMSQSQTFQAFGWGQDGDLPVPTDRDNDGKTDLVIFRPSNNTWYTRFANGTFHTFEFGVVGDKPVVGDFDADGIGDVALFRPSNNNWYIIKSSLGFFIQTWGEAGDVPITGDFDGDGATDQAVFRPSTGQWYLSQTTAGFSVRNWGQNSDIPAAADFDGDGRTDIAVFRPSNGTWYIVNSTAGILVQQFGQNGDVPTQSAFNY